MAMMVSISRYFQILLLRFFKGEEIIEVKEQKDES